MVEAAGQLFHLFRDGPDYAFILRYAQERGVLFAVPDGPKQTDPANVANPSAYSFPFGNQKVYESLQGTEGWPPCTPRRCHVSTPDGRVHRMSPVFTLPSRAKATIAIHDINRTRVRKHYATRSTCVAHSLYLAARYPKGREDAQPAPERFSGPGLEHTGPASL
jgi:hypothetical protein